MADVDSGDILRLGAGMTYDGLYDIVNVWHVEVTAAAGLTWAVATGFIQTYLGALYAQLEPEMSDEILSNVISVTNVTQLTTLGAIGWGAAWQGDDLNEPTAAGVCLFTWGRTYKPRVQIRKYFGVFTEDNMEQGAWKAALRTICRDVMDDHIADEDMGSGVHLQGVAYNREFGTIQYGVSSEGSLEPAYQRRRKRGRGS